MPPVFQGEIPLRLKDGREFTLTLNNETLFEAEQVYGKPVHYLLAHANLGFWGAIRAFLCAALRPKHPAITVADCAAMITGGDLDAITKALESAIEAAMPDPAGQEGEKGSRPTQRGSSSGRNGARSASSRKPSGKPRPARSRSSSAPA
jgi:hypothetical protein